MKILKNPWKAEFLKHISDCDDSIRITTPFIKDDICREMLSAKKESVLLELVTSLKLMNAYSGVLDLSALRRIINGNGSVKNYPKLHSKIYLFDNKKVIITSGNMTKGGMERNFEYGIYTEEHEIINKVLNDFESLKENENTGTIRIEEIDTLKNILDKIPASQRITIPNIQELTPEENSDIIEVPHEILSSSLKGWTKEVFKCILAIPNQKFDLNEINEFEPVLRSIYPGNMHISAKIRQQLQQLRDIGLIEFLGSGRYKKLWR